MSSVGHGLEVKQSPHEFEVLENRTYMYMSCNPLSYFPKCTEFFYWNVFKF